MAGEVRSAVSRRAERAAEERRQRLIVIGALAGLAVVVIIIAAGVYITQYRAPRAHVLTVGGRDYDAAAVARRASFYTLFEGGLRQGGGDSLARTAVALLVDEEVTRQRAGEIVEAVSEQDVEVEIQGLFGLAGSDDVTRYAQLLRDDIQRTGLTRDEYYDVVAVRMLTARLREHFREAIEPSALQLQLSRVRLRDAERAQQVHELAIAGGDFTELVLEHTTDLVHRDDGGDLGWATLDLLAPELAAVVAELRVGEVAPVVVSGLFFDVYVVTGREEDRELDETQLSILVSRRIDAWLEAERQLVAVTLDLSDGEERWVTERVVSDVDRASGR